MPDTFDNTLAMKPLSLNLAFAPSYQIATAMPLSVLQQAVVAVAGGGPTFAAANEPVQDGVAYSATDGIAYYRPLLRVAGRPAPLRPGPDVWFLQDDSGDITFQWSLEAVPLVNAPAGARPLPIAITKVRLTASPDYVLEFPAPGLDPAENAPDGSPPFQVHGGLPLRHDQAAQLESMISRPDAAPAVEVTYTYSYTVEIPQPTDPGVVLVPRHPTGDPIVRDHRHPQIDFQPGHLPGGIFRPRVAEFAAAAEPAAPLIAEAEPAEATSFMSRRVSPLWRDAIVGVNLTDFVRNSSTRPESRTQTVVRSIPFLFEPGEEENGPIYRALHDTADLTGDWQLLGDAGWLKDSDFPNTVFRLPDAVRLAWDAETAAPRMVPTLYRNAAGDPRVRLLLALAPYQDPAKLVLARSGGNMPAARIVAGGTDEGTLRLGSAFPEQLTVIGGTGTSSDLPMSVSTGAELVLDVSLEFYQFFCTMVARPEGVNGQVQVPIGSTPAVGDQPAQPRVVPIPVALRLDRVNDLPCVVSVAPDIAAPQRVTVTNMSGAELSLGGCAATFLQVDADSVVPVDTYPARCVSIFPVTIPAGGSVELELEPQTPSADLIWNGVLVELLDKKLTSSPDNILKKVHELAAAGDVGRPLTLSSPVFQADSLPAQWASLVSVEVLLTVAGTAPVTVVLSKANPSRTVSLPMSLQDLVQSTPGGVTVVNFQVRNNYADRQGTFGGMQQQSGTDLVVYPRQVADDTPAG